jgi:hypothetical protein
MKKIICFVCAIVLMLSVSILAGCNNNYVGKLFSGESEPTVESYVKIGDFYINESTCEFYKFTKDGWVLIGTVKGENGENGTNGVSIVKSEVVYENDIFGQKYLSFIFTYDNEKVDKSSFLIPEKGFAHDYEDFKTELETAQSGDTIKITGDITVTGESAFVIDKEITIELNGFTISTPNDTVGDGVFRVINGGKLTINGDGTINGVNTTDYAMAIWVDGGEVIINGGTYTNENAGEDTQYDLMYVKNGGKLTINGGTFISKTPKWTLNLNDTNGGEIVVCGGSFFEYNPSNSETENPIANFVADGYEVKETVEENGTWYNVSAVEEEVEVETETQE